MDVRTKRWKTIFFIISAVLLLICSFYYLPHSYNIFFIRDFLHDIENSSLVWRFSSKALGLEAIALGSRVINVREREGVYNKMYIVSVDSKTLNFFKSNVLDRKVWANAINYLGRQKYPPDLILFDVFFTEPSPDPKSDIALSEALKKYKGLVGEDFMLYTIRESTIRVIGQRGSGRDFSKDRIYYNSPEVQSLKKFELKLSQDLPYLQPHYKIRSILSNISDNLKFAGTANIVSHEIGEEIYRKNPLILRAVYGLEGKGTNYLTNIYYPSVVLAATVQLLNSSFDNVVIEKNKIVIKNALWKNKRIDYVIPVDDQYRLSINYKSSPSSGYIRMIPLEDITRSGLPKNSILVFGVLIEGATDNKWLSPLGIMYSAEHIGYSLGTILNRDFIVEIPEWISLFYIILFTTIIGLLLLKNIRTTIIAFFLSILFPILLGFSLFQFNIIIVTLIPVITSLLVLIIGEIYILFTEEKEKRFIKSTFSKYVSPDLVNILIQNPDMALLGGQEKQATVLFSDIRGFTTLSEGMPPGKLIDFLNNYLTRMTNIVMEMQGTLDKYIGDAIVAFWGAPIEMPDHAVRACKASIKMMEMLKDFNEEQIKAGYKPINIGVGLNTGPITAGNIGSEKKRNYTAIGMHVNIAEELQDENKSYNTNIIISEYTYNHVKDIAIVRELDSIYIKGSKSPIKIYELLDLKV